MTSFLLINGDAKAIPLRDNSVDLICTSPPFAFLRSYLDAGHAHKALEIGSESSLDQYVAAMVAVGAECRRVLKKSGVMLLEIGDTYTNAGRSNNSKRSEITGGDPGCGHEFVPMHVPEWPLLCHKCGARQKQAGTGGRKHDNGGKPRYTPDAALGEKQCSLVPFRVALALQAAGWTLRSWWPWIRRNPMPESTTDRPSNGLSVWLMLTKQARGYYWDGESIRRVPVTSGRGEFRQDGEGTKTSQAGPGDGRRYPVWYNNPAGRAFRNTDPYFDSLDLEIETRRAELARLEALRAAGGVLEDGGDILALDVPTSGYAGAHYATFPGRLIEPLVQAGSSERGVCGACGAPWRRVVERGDFVPDAPGYKPRGESKFAPEVKRALFPAGATQGHPNHHYEYKTVDWQAGCTCQAPTVPATVLDPFCGSGTTLAVALKHGRRAIGLDLSFDYLQQHARPRLEHDPDVRAVRAYAGHDTTPRASERALDGLPIFAQEPSPHPAAGGAS